MRPTGSLHLGHYHGVLKNWVTLQNQFPCLFFVADWHALTTQYDDTEGIEKLTWEMIIDWLAAGIDPDKAILFIQSHIPEHAELHLLLSMMTPLGWLLRVPTYKDQQEKLSDKDLSTYGFLGYPLLMSSDILIYRADKVPVGEDQLPHIEFTREIARRFNHMYGREPGHEEKAMDAIKKLGSQNARIFEQLKTRFQQEGDSTAILKARALLNDAQSLTNADRERLYGYLEGVGRIILIEPDGLLTEASRMPGLDGQKMSKSYNNTITLREDEASVTQKIKRMPTDPARIRRTDPGNPEKCPVFALHQIYSDKTCRENITAGCTSAGIGCLECKQPIIEAILEEQVPMRDRAQTYLDNPKRVKDIIVNGNQKARRLAQETMQDVRSVMGLCASAV